MKAMAMDSRVTRLSSSSIFRIARTSAPMKNDSGTRGSNMRNRRRGWSAVAPTKYSRMICLIRPARAQRNRGRLKRGRQVAGADIESMQCLLYILSSDLCILPR